MLRTIDPDGIYWKRLVFTRDNIRMDVAAFRSYAYLLVPPAGHVILFRAQSSENKVEFFAGADAPDVLSRFASFFFHMYGTYAEDGIPQDIEGNRISLIPVWKKVPDFYHPALLKSIIFLPTTLKGIKIDYTAVISSRRRLGKRRFSFAASILSDAPFDRVVELVDILRFEAADLREKTGLKLRIVSGERITFRNDRFTTPFHLATFVRIPSDQDLEVIT